MNKVIFAMLLLLSSIYSHAGGRVGWNIISSIAFQNQDLMLYSENWGNPNGCTQINAIILKKTDPNFDKAYSMLLAAYMAGKQVNAFSEGCHTFDSKTFNYIRGWKYLQIK